MNLCHILADHSGAVSWWYSFCMQRVRLELLPRSHPCWAVCCYPWKLGDVDAQEFDVRFFLWENLENAEMLFHAETLTVMI